MQGIQRHPAIYPLELLTGRVIMGMGFSMRTRKELVKAVSMNHEVSFDRSEAMADAYDRFTLKSLP